MLDVSESNRAYLLKKGTLDSSKGELDRATKILEDMQENLSEKTAIQKAAMDSLQQAEQESKKAALKFTDAAAKKQSTLTSFSEVSR
jgi:hypothetical protein